MPRSDGRLEPGQRLNGAISARAWNRMMDAADAVHGNRYSVAGTGAAASLGPFTCVLAKYDGDDDMRMGYPYSIAGLAISPVNSSSTLEDQIQDEVASFISMPVLKTTTPYLGGSTHSFCVPVEPITAGSIGRVAVDGVVPAFVRFSDVNHRYASFGNYGSGNSPMLMSSFAAGAQVLWRSRPTVVNVVDLCLVKMNTAAPVILSGTQTDDLEWPAGSSKTVLLDDASWIPGGSTPGVRTVTVVNRLRNLSAKAERKAYLSWIGGEFQLLSAAENQA